MNKREAEIERRLPENPFTRTLIIPVSATYSFTAYVKVDGVKVPKPIYPDKSPHVKLFYDCDAADKVFGLSERAKNLYLYILYSLTSGRDWITLDASRYKTKTGVKSRATLAKAKEELYKARFIDPTSIRSIYFINPAYFFAGSRSVKFSNHLQIIPDRNTLPDPESLAAPRPPKEVKQPITL